MARGRKPRASAFQVVREGNPGHRPVEEGVVLPPQDLVEPDWPDALPGDGDEQVQLRATVHELWTRLAPTLARSIGLVHAHQSIFQDYCVTVARIEQGERAQSQEGLVVLTERGYVKNPWTTILNAYRANLRALTSELGLSPSAAARLRRPILGGDDDDEDPFDK